MKKIDGHILKWAYQHPLENSLIIRTLIFMGDGPFWMIVLFTTALAGQLLNSEILRQLVILIMFGMIISNVAFVFCKTYVKRKRPYANMHTQEALGIQIQNRDPGHGSKELESFPSGHVLWTTINVSLFFFQLGYIPLLILGWMIPAMIYLRLHLGVHYPSDVLASLILGSVTVVITVSIAPDIIEFTNGLRDHPGFLYGYWAFISGYLIVGFKSWLKRV